MVSQLLARRRRKPRSKEKRALEGLVEAKTLLGKTNYAIDLLDAYYPDRVRDETLHFAAEMLLGKGSGGKRLVRWGKKFWKHRDG